MKIIIKKFDELKVDELYKILQLRADVFVLDDKSFFRDIDGNDYSAVHFFSQKDNHIIAYARILKKSPDAALLSRLIVDKKHRKKGIGKQLTEECLKYIKSNWNVKRINTQAQDYLQKFYEGFGFKQTSDVYDDVGVPHIDMVLEL